MSAVRVHIEYGEDSTYAEKFKEMAAGVAKAIPGTEVTGEVGRPSSFEVSANDSVIYSKLEKKDFPDVQEIVKLVGEKVKGAVLSGEGENNPLNKVKNKCTLQ